MSTVLHYTFLGITVAGTNSATEFRIYLFCHGRYSYAGDGQIGLKRVGRAGKPSCQVSNTDMDILLTSFGCQCQKARWWLLLGAYGRRCSRHVCALRCAYRSFLTAGDANSIFIRLVVTCVPASLGPFRLLAARLFNLPSSPLVSLPSPARVPRSCLCLPSPPLPLRPHRH